MTVLVVEQNANLALELRRPRLRAGDRAASRSPATRRQRPGRRERPTRLPGVLTWSASSQLVVDGIADGLDLRRAGAGARADLPRDRHPQLRPGRDGDVHHLRRLGALIEAGLPLGLAVLAHARRLVVRRRHGHRARARSGPSRAASRSTLVIVTLGLFILLNSARGLDLGLRQPRLPEPVRQRQRRRRRACAIERRVARASSRCCSPSSGCCSCSSQRTKLGLAMRAVALNPESSRLVGDPGRAHAHGRLGARRGSSARWPASLVAPRLFLDVNFMGGVLIYAFAAATLGGFDSPLGAVRRRLDHRRRRDAGRRLRRLHRLGPEDPRPAGDHPRRAARPPAAASSARSEVARA